MESAEAEQLDQPPQSDYDRDRDAVSKIAGARDSIRAELSKIIVGQEEVIDEVQSSTLTCAR